MTYGQIATLLGTPNCARRVGQAMFNTPEYLKIPAHRVVNSKGELAPPSVFSGEGIQRKRLEDEGVLFKKNGCMDLKKYIYRIKKTNQLQIPEDFAKKVQRILPDKGRAWLEELPVLLEEFIQKWQLTDCKIAKNLSIQFIRYAKCFWNGSSPAAN